MLPLTGVFHHQNEFAFHQSYRFDINYDKKSILSLPPVEDMQIELLNEKNKKDVLANQLKQNTCEKTLLAGALGAQSDDLIECEKLIS